MRIEVVVLVEEVFDVHLRTNPGRHVEKAGHVHPRPGRQDNSVIGRREDVVARQQADGGGNARREIVLVPKRKRVLGQLGQDRARLRRGRNRLGDHSVLVGISTRDVPRAGQVAVEAKLEPLGALRIDEEGQRRIDWIGHDDIAPVEPVQGRGEREVRDDVPLCPNS